MAVNKLLLAVGEEYALGMIQAYVPDAGDMTFSDALLLAYQRDQEAALQLALDAMEVEQRERA